MKSFFKLSLNNLSVVCQVVEQGMFVKHCKVEVYLTELKLCEDSNMDNMITRRFSKADTIGRPEAPATNLFTQLLKIKSALTQLYLDVNFANPSICFNEGKFFFSSHMKM